MQYDQTLARENFFDSYQKKKKELERYMKEWEKLSLEFDKLR
jgi:ATP-binding cassette subfamily F protein 3